MESPLPAQTQTLDDRHVTLPVAGEKHIEEHFEKEQHQDFDDEIFDEDLVVGMMAWLAGEIEGSPAGEAAGTFVTINGNEESCGPSFSVAGTTVMASLDSRGGGGGVAPFFFGPAPAAWAPAPAPAAEEVDAWLGAGDGE